MKRILICLFTFILSIQLFSQSDNLAKISDYHFILQDSPAQLFTMRQVNESYLSGYRLFARGVNAVSSNDYVSNVVQVGLLSFILMPLTHEEGHRSILTVNNIGSISQPYMNKHGAAYVNGVTNETLQHLRDTDLPTYIRLHAGGLESDYMLTRRVESIASFDMDQFKNIKWEYWIRKLSLLQYYATGLIKYDIDIKLEKNELDRDIVGHDVYGAARHLHRPTMVFHRYTRYKDLTSDEKNYVHRLGYRSFLNLLNPLVYGFINFALSPSLNMNGGLGYTMSPFGDFIDENIWLKYKAMNIHFYARQFQNKQNWFPAFGISLNDYFILRPLSIIVAAHYWQQPQDFDFRTSESFSGGALDVDMRYFFFLTSDNMLKAVSIGLGFIYKSKGYLPEELYLDEHFGFRIGTSVRL